MEHYFDLQRLGHLIRYWRKQKNLSQYKLGSRCGSLQRAISEIERGLRRPEPETLARICQTLDIPHSQRSMAFGWAGYRPLTAWPSPTSLATSRHVAEQQIKQAECIAYILDYQYRIWSINTYTEAALGGSSNLHAIRESVKYPITTFEVLLREDLPHVEYIQNRGALTKTQMIRFHYLNSERQWEPFFQNYPEKMQSRLPESGFKLFSTLWKEAEKTKPSDDSFPFTAEIQIQLDNDIVAFNIRSVPWVDLPNMMFTVFYQPKTASDLRCWERFVSLHRLNPTIIRLWEPASEAELHDH